MKRSILVMGLVLFLTNIAQAQGITLPFLDDFNGSVSSFWQITNEDSTKYSLTENPGYLRLYTTPTDVWATHNDLINLFTVPSQEGIDSFTVTTKISFSTPPYSHPQQAGIILLGEVAGLTDMENFVRVTYGYIDGCRRLHRAYEINGDPNNTSYWGPCLDIGTNPIWIRIVKSGASYNAYYSLDGTNYSLFNSFSASLPVAYIGLGAFHSEPYNQSIPVDFDYFEIIAEPPTQYREFTATFAWPYSFSIYGHLPIPQQNGFDYYFTPLALDSSLIGNGVIISSIDVSAEGTSIGSVINWDWEVHLGPSPFGLPEGQFTKATTDPVSGYLRIAPTQLEFVIGDGSASGDFIFSGNYDFTTGTMTATPSLGALKNASTSEMNLTAGLYAQLFFWTGDNRDCHILFENATLTVRGKIKIPTSQQITIDIKPGSDPNCFNQNERGVIPVAILGSADLDVKQINVDSLSLQGLSVKMVGKTSSYLAHYDYVNGDAHLDLLVQFADSDDWTPSGTDNAILTGTLLDGTPIEGQDSICIIP